LTLFATHCDLIESAYSECVGPKKSFQAIFQALASKTFVKAVANIDGQGHDASLLAQDGPTSCTKA
jgi:hypothetical protein